MGVDTGGPCISVSMQDDPRVAVSADAPVGSRSISWGVKYRPRSVSAHNAATNRPGDLTAGSGPPGPVYPTEVDPSYFMTGGQSSTQLNGAYPGIKSTKTRIVRNRVVDGVEGGVSGPGDARVVRGREQYSLAMLAVDIQGRNLRVGSRLADMNARGNAARNESCVEMHIGFAQRIARSSVLRGCMSIYPSGDVRDSDIQAHWSARVSLAHRFYRFLAGEVFTKADKFSAPTVGCRLQFFWGSIAAHRRSELAKVVGRCREMYRKRYK